MNILIAIALSLPIGALSLLFTRRQPASSRAYATIAVIAVAFIIAWPTLEAFRPSANFASWRETEDAKRSRQIDLPTVGRFAVDRKTGKVDGQVIKTGMGDKGPIVQIRFNEGFTPTFLLSAAYDRWEFVADRAGRENSPPAMGSPASSTAEVSPAPGRKLYTKDQGRYGGKILETEDVRGLHVEWFNGKKEWIHEADAREKYSIR